MAKFIQGATNHLNWVMVDATDFATPESALSAAMKIKIYGELNTAAGVNFVSSGTGSLTNDITHVGASATGQYHIALAVADLSDASAAFYDHYVITLSATGAAYQTIIADGERTDTSYISNVLSYLSNVASYLSNFASNASGVISDIRSGTSDTNSKLVVMSGILSDVDSALSSQFVNQSNQFSYLSATVSGLGAGQTASAIADKVWSDYGSKVGATPSQVYSALLVGASAASDAASGVTVLLSRVTGAVATASDVASKVWAEKYTAASNVKASTFGSALRLNMSRISDVQSYLVVMSGAISDVDSALNSQFAVVSNYLSNASNFQSDILSTLGSQFAVQSNYLSYISATVSGLGAGQTASAIADKVWSDFTSKAGASPSQLYSVLLIGTSAASDAASAAAQANSRVLLVQSRLSDLDSRIASDFSDIMSNIDAVTAAVSASDISDIASAVADALGSRLSDILSAAVQTNSRVLVVQSLASDAHSAAVVAQSIGASDMSDLRSAIAGVTATVSASDISDISSSVRAALVSDLSDILSAAQQANSRVLLVQSRLSELNSAYTSDISDVRSMLTALSGAISDIDSATNSQYSDLLSTMGSQFSDLGSKIGAVSVTLGASDISDLASQVVSAITGAVMDANVVQVNGSTIDGDGSAGNPWGPA